MSRYSSNWSLLNFRKNEHTKHKQKLSKAISELGVSLMRIMYPQVASQSNTVFAPFSIYTALALIFLGSEGDTRTEIAEIMKLPRYDDFNRTLEMLKMFGEMIQDVENTIEVITSNESEPASFRFTDTPPSARDIAANVKALVTITNGLFTQKGFSFNPSYVFQTQSYNKSDVSTVDLQNDLEYAIQTINEYVSKATNHKVTQLLKKTVRPATGILLVCCINFEADWETKFCYALTKSTIFEIGSHYTVVDMMCYKDAHPFLYVRSRKLKYQAVGLPYKGNEITMFVILPKLGQSLDTLIASLKSKHLRKIVNESKLCRVHVKLPRCGLKCAKIMKEDLQQLDAKQLFTERAELNNMVTVPFTISDIAHATAIGISEEGTEITGPTRCLDCVTDCCEVTPSCCKLFHCNRPFMFFIHHRSTNAVLFTGVVRNPNK